MISPKLTGRADELVARGEAFVTATVVRVERPTSAQPGNVALVHEDGTIEGFVGGVCAQNSVRLYALRAIERGEPMLLRILPEEGESEPSEADDGSVTVQNPCLSGGAIEVFLEPFLPPPRVVVAGESPIALALAQLGQELGLDVAATAEDPGARPKPGDLALVVAAHGRSEAELLRAGVEAGIEYVGLVASHRRGDAVIEELREAGVDDDLLAAIDYPAGIDIGARSPSEIALSILAQIVAVRRSGERTSRIPAARATIAPATAIDPICGMTVVIGPDTPRSEHDGEAVYFCCEGCQRRFDEQRA